MAKRLTITVSDEVYDGLHRRVGRRHIGRFLDDLTRPHVTEPQPGGPGWEQGIAEQYRSAAAEAADPVLTRETNDRQRPATEDWNSLRDEARQGPLGRS